MNENIWYKYSDTAGELTEGDSPLIFEGRHDRFYKTMIKQHFADTDLMVLSWGYEVARPDKRLVNRAFPFSFFLHFAIKGKGTYNGVPVGPGDGFLCWPGLTHTLISDPEDTLHFYWIELCGRQARRYFLDRGYSPDELFFRFDTESPMIGYLDDILHRDFSRADFASVLVSYFHIVMAYLLYDRENEAKLPQNTRYTHVIRAMRYINDNLDQVTLEKLGEYFNLSPKYLSKLFYEYKGCSVKQYILTERMNMATELLQNTNEPIKAIAARIGYDDYAQFSKMFQKRNRISPRAFRALSWQERSAMQEENVAGCGGEEEDDQGDF